MNLLNLAETAFYTGQICALVIYFLTVSGDELRADVAQLVEQPIRNQQVKGSSPFIGSIFRGVAQFGSAFGSGPKGRRFKSCHLDQKTAGNLRISGFFLCNLHKDVSLVPFPCNYFATFQNVPKGRKDQYIVLLHFLTTIYCKFVLVILCSNYANY